MWWSVIVGGLLIAVLVSGFSAGAARMFGPEPNEDPDPLDEDDDEWERKDFEHDDW